MKLFKTLSFTSPLRGVRMTGASASPAANQRQDEDAAYERGRRDAEKALSEQLLAQRGEMLELHQGVISSLRATFPKVSNETQKALVDLALEAAQRIVAAIPIQPEMVEAVVREALDQVEDSAEITVHLHAEDLALLQKHESPIFQNSPETGPLRFTHSSDVPRGGCIVHTRFGLIDARRETKIEQLRQSLSS